MEDGDHVARRVALPLAARHPAEARGERHVHRVPRHTVVRVPPVCVDELKPRLARVPPQRVEAQRLRDRVGALRTRQVRFVGEHKQRQRKTWQQDKDLVVTSLN